MLSLDMGGRFQAAKSSYSETIVTNGDNRTKTSRDRQFDMLKKVRCRCELKISLDVIFRYGC